MCIVVFNSEKERHDQVFRCINLRHAIRPSCNWEIILISVCLTNIGTARYRLQLTANDAAAGKMVMKPRPYSWWRHQIETFSALLALCAGYSPVTGEFPPPPPPPTHPHTHTQRPVTRSFDVFFDLRLNKRLSKQSWGWWFETPSRSSRHHCNECRGLSFSPLLGNIGKTRVWIKTWNQSKTYTPTVI